MKAYRLLVILLLLLPGVAALAADPAQSSDTAVQLVTVATVEARLKEVDASTDLDETTKGTLTSLLTKTLGYLEAVRTNDAATASYKQALQTAPQQTDALREKLDKASAEDAVANIESTADSPFEDIEQELLQEKANLAAVKEKLANIEDQLATQSDRPNAVRKRLAEVKSQRASLDSALKLTPPTNELPWLTEARRWSQQAQLEALRSESGMLDQELLSQPVRVRLLEARRENELRSISRIADRVRQLEALANQKGRAVAEEAAAEAIVAVSDAADKHVLVQKLAAENAELTQTLKTLTAELVQVSSSDEEIIREAKNIDTNYRTSQEKLQIAGMSEILGE
ncbi:MAG TPA: hypothetical protein VET88_16370, partial [Gammaproteobacteria bacterium]|nr:hypothetical protein [Gammaproteobacteria bacterium]